MKCVRNEKRLAVFSVPVKMAEKPVVTNRPRTHQNCEAKLPRSRTTKSQCNRPSFFKILLAPDFSKLLKIPRPFIKHFNGSVPETFILRSPTKKRWRVRVKKVKEQWYLQKGWQSFVKFHSLVVGDLLIFSYRGGAKFSVKIYDRSACEKELPFSSSAYTQRNPVDSSHPHPKKGRRGERKAGGLQKPVVSTKVNRGCAKPKKRRPINEAIEAARSYKTESPHFVALCLNLTKTSISVPRAVAKEIGLTNKVKAVLWDPRGRQWHVNVSPMVDGRLNISGGWTDFLNANDIAKGEACHFEFGSLQGTGIVIRVNIFRTTGLGELACFPDAAKWQ